jgi:hypothetical protein
VRRRTATLLIAVAGLVSASIASTAAGAATVEAGHGRFIPAHKGQLLPKKNADTASLNWSGYATVPDHGITGVNSTFTVPSVNPVPPGFSANWAGIGGYDSSDLIQAGTSQDELEGNYAWYEILPASETLISGCSGDANCTVNAGDVVSVDIHLVGTNLWSVSLTDAGHWSWQKNINYTSTQSSAEWIFEAPTVGVQTIPANTGVNHFGPTSTFTDASGTHTIAQGNPVSIAMGTGLVNEATPSDLAADGQSFNVCAYAQSCAAP